MYKYRSLFAGVVHVSPDKSQKPASSIELTSEISVKIMLTVHIFILFGLKTIIF